MSGVSPTKPHSSRCGGSSTRPGLGHSTRAVQQQLPLVLVAANISRGPPRPPRPRNDVERGVVDLARFDRRSEVGDAQVWRPCWRGSGTGPPVRQGLVGHTTRSSPSPLAGITVHSWAHTPDALASDNRAERRQDPRLDSSALSGVPDGPRSGRTAMVAVQALVDVLAIASRTMPLINGYDERWTKPRVDGDVGDRRATHVDAVGGRPRERPQLSPGRHPTESGPFTAALHAHQASSVETPRGVAPRQPAIGSRPIPLQYRRVKPTTEQTALDRPGC